MVGMLFIHMQLWWLMDCLYVAIPFTRDPVGMMECLSIQANTIRLIECCPFSFALAKYTWYTHRHINATQKSLQKRLILWLRRCSSLKVVYLPFENSDRDIVRGCSGDKRKQQTTKKRPVTEEKCNPSKYILGLFLLKLKMCICLVIRHTVT